MADAGWSRERYGEAFWRAHHESWQQSDLNQREYCEAHGLSLKAFGNWRAKFKAEPLPRPHKLLYRRGGLSHRLSHTLSHSLSHMTNGTPERTLNVPPARDGHRRTFSEADKRRIVQEAGQPSASPFRGGASLWDSGACAVPLEAGVQADRCTDVRHSADR